MDFNGLNRCGLVILGCGKMGSAMLAGWLERGLAPEACHVIDPNPSEWLRETGVRLGAELPSDPAVLIIAVKPQIMDAALPQVARFGGGGTLLISIAAGTPIARFEAAFGPGTPVVRAMPNTPAAIGKGISAIIGNTSTGDAELALADGLLSAVGRSFGWRPKIRSMPSRASRAQGLPMCST